MLVDNYTELEIVAVLNWEWAYMVLYQMLYSPPRWLLKKAPVYWDKVKSPDLTLRHKNHFNKFVQTL